MSDTDTIIETPAETVSERLLGRVRKLLDQAESTTNEAEKIAFTDKALALMAEHRITEAMLDAARSKIDRGKIVERTINVGAGPYTRARLSLLVTIGRAYACEHVTRTGFEGRTCDIMGYETDVAAVEFLYTSLLAQATHAYLAEPVPAGQHGTAFRRDFLNSFGYRIGDRLRLINARVTTAAEVVAEAEGSTSVALVLVDRTEAVRNEHKARHGKLRTLGAAASGGWTGGSGAGRAAADRADIGQSAVGGSRAGIGSGA